MSRIDDALKRITGGPAEPRLHSVLDRYAPEKGNGPGGENRKFTFVPVEVTTRAVEAKPSFPQAVPAPPKAVPRPAAANFDVEPITETERLVDVRQVVDYVGFLGRSLRRHKLLAAGTFLTAVAMTAAAVVLLPKSYHVGTKLLAQRNSVMSALSNPGRAIPWDADAPTRAAAETVLRRDNLISLITQTDLIRDWERTRAPILKWKDRLVAVVTRHTPTPDEKLDLLIGLLETRMIVLAGPVGDGTVTIDLDWPDGEMAYRLVQAAQQAFLDARQVAEAAAINESIGILERYSASLHGDVNRTIGELQRSRAKRGPVAPLAGLGPVRRASASALPVLAGSARVPQLEEALESDANLNRDLKTILTSKRQELARLDEARQRQLTELQARLAQVRMIYTANHPSVMSLQQNIAALSTEPPRSRALAAEIEELQTAYDKRVADATDLQINAELARRSVGAAARGSAAPQAIGRVPGTSAGPPSDSQDEFATLRLRSELNQLQSVLERTDGARIELAVSQAAFKYRYTVIRPAQIPRNPTFPDWRLIVAAGAFASVFLALAVVVCEDLLSNRILEPWQVERQLGLRLLGTSIG